MMRHDPIELTPEFKAAEPAVDALIRTLIGKQGGCRQFWKLKKQILLRDYGIRWKSPAELNPEAEFDGDPLYAGAAVPDPGLPGGKHRPVSL